MKRSLVIWRRMLSICVVFGITLGAANSFAQTARSGGVPARGPAPAARGARGAAGAATANFASPEVAADGKVTFRLNAPNAQSVRVEGDFVPRADSLMTKDATSGLWTLTVGPLKPDLYDFEFNIDGVTIPDPSDNYLEVGAYWFHSLFEVKGPETAFFDAQHVPHGTLHQHYYEYEGGPTGLSKAAPVTRRIVVYTPPGYDSASASTESYPVLYLLHGYGDDELAWTYWGHVQFIMDNLLAAKKTKPAIIVMPYGHSGWPVGRGSARPAMPDERAMLEADLKQNIIPMVEKTYRVKKDRESRAICGLSMGGFQSMTIGLNNPALFAYVAGFSSALRGTTPQGTYDEAVANFLADPAKANKDTKLLWFGCGGDDGLLSGNQQLDASLTAKGIKHDFVTTPGYAHTWRLWRIYIRDLLPKLFN